jgi:hypothetical protein
MKKLLWSSTLLLLLAACGPKPGSETARNVYPVDLKVTVDDEAMTLSWKKQGDGNISGYNIYISEEPLVAKYPGPAIDPEVETYNVQPFPGDTNPEDGIEYFDAKALENGVRYYVSVRVVYPDGSVSKPTEEVEAVCGPRGEIELAIRYQGEHDGYSFKMNEYVEADGVANDLYFFNRGDAYFLGSPKRLSGFINDTRFLKLPFAGSYAEVAEQLASTKMTATDDQVEIAPGDWLLLECNGGTHALVNVREIDGAGRDARVTLFFAYSAIVGEIFF